MDELKAATVFDELHARAMDLDLVTAADALAFLEAKRFSGTESGAIEHYAAEGSSMDLLAERAREIGSACVAAAAIAADLSRQPALREPGTLRRHFQDTVVSLVPSLRGQTAPARARRLVGSLLHRLGVARSMLERAEHDQVDAWMAARDFVDAAALAALIAMLAEDPSRLTGP